jgi:hypothetical protein
VNSLVTIFVASTLIASSFVFSADRNVTFEGTISATLARGGIEPAYFVFTRKGNQLRIENTTNKLEPINVVDLEARKLTILFSHNTTFVRVDLPKPGAQAGAPPRPPNFPTPAAVNPPPSGAAASRVGPQVSPPPGFPSPPPILRCHRFLTIPVPPPGPCLQCQ